MRPVIKIIFPLLLLLFVASCTKYERKRRPNTNITGFSIEVGINDKLSTGQIIEHEAPVSVIHVWKADNQNLEILSVGEAIDGYATDQTSGQLVSAYYSSLSAPASVQSTEGKYFIFLMLDESPSVGEFAYSYTSFEVIKGEQTTLKKTFTSHATGNQFEDWYASE